MKYTNNFRPVRGDRIKEGNDYGRIIDVDSERENDLAMLLIKAGRWKRVEAFARVNLLTFIKRCPWYLPWQK